MVFNPARPEIATVTSETLQAKIRQLLPSQDGFGTDLAAQNVIVPIIDLTESAQGSDVPQNLQTAIAFGSVTAFSAGNGSDVIENTAGFYRVFGTSNIESQGSGLSCEITITDGATTKVLFTDKSFSGAVGPTQCVPFDFIVFLRSGDTLTAVSGANEGLIVGVSRQIADANGVLVNPSGFTPQ